jgi:MoxR-like ATPase
MMHIRLLEARGDKVSESELFGEEFLLRRPLLQAIGASKQKPPVLLIDELDRSDEEFEAFLLEVLSDFQITIPEIGTIKTSNPPVVIVTSNRTREVHDALKRRCLYYWIDYPSFEKELEIVQTQLPNAPAQLARQITGFIQALREMDLYKLPGVAETIDWTTALVALDQKALDPIIVDETLGAVLKYQDDVEKIRGQQARLILERIQAGVD